VTTRVFVSFNLIIIALFGVLTAISVWPHPAERYHSTVYVGYIGALLFILFAGARVPCGVLERELIRLGHGRKLGVGYLLGFSICLLPSIGEVILGVRPDTIVFNGYTGSQAIGFTSALFVSLGSVPLCFALLVAYVVAYLGGSRSLTKYPSGQLDSVPTAHAVVPMSSADKGPVPPSISLGFTKPPSPTSAGRDYRNLVMAIGGFITGVMGVAQGMTSDWRRMAETFGAGLAALLLILLLPKRNR
jgi:hypothetical protein